MTKDSEWRSLNYRRAPTHFFSRPNFTLSLKQGPRVFATIFGFHQGCCWIMAGHRQRLSTYRSPKPQDSRSSRQRIKSTHGGRGRTAKTSRGSLCSAERLAFCPFVRPAGIRSSHADTKKTTATSMFGLLLLPLLVLVVVMMMR